MTVKFLANSGITMRQAYQVCGQPCTSSRGGPAPPITACSRTSPVSMNRLVNVSVNPSGRLGAPETEPGPCGLDVDDEFMRIPVLELSAATAFMDCACADMRVMNCAAATAIAAL